MTTIYLSSTYEDLKDHRRAVFAALRKSGYQVIAMEDYVATDRRPVEKCLNDIEKADIYVGLFAFRYGYVPPAGHGNSNGFSITELELRHAEKLGKPCLTFVVSEDARWPVRFIDSLNGERINKLREYLLTEKTVSLFSSPHQLASDVQAALAKQFQVHPAITEGKASPTIIWDVDKNGSPYPGLMHYTRKYAPVFFGREAEVREILDRMRLPEGRFVIISGDSGVGKSSVIDAGVLPRAESGALADNTKCVCLRMLPSQGNHPFNALMTTLGLLAARAGFRPDSIVEELKRSPHTLTQHLRKILAGSTDGSVLVLFLDQMEELFTAQDVHESNVFLTALYNATQEDALRVLATIRSDHLQHCHTHREMLQVLRGPGHYPLGPVEPFMLSDLIVKPAECAGLGVSETLARHIVHDTGTDTGSLPLLAFVLNQLFEQRSGRQLSETVYKSLGGVTGAIAKHAEQVEANVQRERGVKALDLLPKLFQSLVIIEEHGLPTRRRPLLSDFPAELSPLVDVLVQGRLLQTEREGQTATASISHEKLFDAWPSLRDYVAANKKQLTDQTLLERRARKWAEMGKPWFSGLAAGREYRDFQRAKLTATSEMRDYLSASRRAVWLANSVMGFAMFLIGATVWLWQKDYTLDQALLKLQSIVVSIHIAPKMVAMPAGMYRQGDIRGTGESYERPIREVTINAFSIGTHEVTFEEYDRFAIGVGRRLPEDEGWGRGRRPVINISWEEAAAYAQWLSKATGNRYRLPTESEWEYAARSGGSDEIWTGTSDPTDLVNYAVFAGNSQGRTAAIGGKRPNRLGIHDLSGNVWEWVEDCVHLDYRNAPTDGSAWLTEQGGNCGQRVFRGGSWGDGKDVLRASFRGWNDSGYGGNVGVGFRLAQDID